jgi:DNA-binding response OmpR family regulator
MTERVLVVEDEPLIAFDVAEYLREAGFEVVGPAASVSAALRLLKAQGCDLAVLDVNLGRETAAPIADALAAKSLPFIALSGYSSDQLPKGFENAPMLTKPVDPKRLVAELRRLKQR